MDRQQVDAALGRALDEDPKAEVQTYRRDDFLIIVFYGGKGRKIDTFRFTRPNVHSARKFNIELQAAAAETPGAAAQPLSARNCCPSWAHRRTTPPLAPGWTSMASTTVRMRPWR